MQLWNVLLETRLHTACSEATTTQKKEEQCEKLKRALDIVGHTIRLVYE